MRVRVFKRGIFFSLVSGMGSLVFTAVMIAMIALGVRQAGTSQQAEGLRLLEEALQRAAMHSYAINGYFPESLEYLLEHSQLHIDESRFFVHYEIFARNVMPHITVIELNR
jgi:hypothetical protein